MSRLREISERLTAIARELEGEGSTTLAPASWPTRPPSSPPRRSRRPTGASAKARPPRSERLFPVRFFPLCPG